jgi:hypothetical protein
MAEFSYSFSATHASGGTNFFALSDVPGAQLLDQVNDSNWKPHGGFGEHRTQVYNRTHTG